MERDSGRERDCRGCRGVSACLTEVGEENERQKERERERVCVRDLLTGSGRFDKSCLTHLLQGITWEGDG